MISTESLWVYSGLVDMEAEECGSQLGGNTGCGPCWNWPWLRSGTHSLKVIAERQQISEHYLEQLMGTYVEQA